MDYQSNSKKTRDPQKPEKKVAKVIVGEVVLPKRKLGRKIKDLFIAADLKTVATYVALDVLLPAARNMIVDGATKGIEKAMYGDRAIRARNYGHGPRVTYNNPINRDFRDPATRPPSGNIGRIPRAGRNDFILTSREEANLVLERMNDIIETYDAVSVADLNDLVGFPQSHIDNKWGWTFLSDVDVRQVPEGFLIDFPSAEPL